MTQRGKTSGKARLSQTSRWMLLYLSVMWMGALSVGCVEVINIGRDDGATTSRQDGGAGVTSEPNATPDTPPDATAPSPDRTVPSPDRTPPPPDVRKPPQGCPGSCKPGQRKSCYSGPPETAGKGLCKAGIQICDTQCSWGSCLGESKPSPEVCDGLDNNCDGKVDNNPSGVGGSCKTGARPGACSSGRMTCEKGKKVCIPITPGPETCDGLDNNCDGKVDNIPDAGKPCTVPGGKGVCRTGLFACRSNKKTCLARPPTTEVCDKQDNDCDGKVDESDARNGKPCTVSGAKGACAKGVYQCTKSVMTCIPANTPKPETCDGIDNNCDGKVDENTGTSCYTGPAKARGVGACVTGRTSCVNGKPGPCVGSVLPATETCDSLDNDCDGSVDEGNVCTKPGRGAAFRINSLSIAGSGVGFDLNGDGKKDNSLSVIGSFVNSTLQQSIRSGSVNLLIELASLSNSTAQSGTATVYLYTGRSGSGGYSIEKTSLDSSGKPLFRFAARITSGLLTGGPGRAVLSLPLIGAATPLRLEKAYIQFRIPKDLKSLTNGLLAGGIPASSLDQIPATNIPLFGGPGKTALDVLVQLGRQPDVDLDRDGLESFSASASTGITLCTDGNKITKISGGNCPRDKRIADGLSVTFSFTATRTKILGVAP